MRWPARSPDLAPMDFYAWGAWQQNLERMVGEKGYPRDKIEFKAYIMACRPSSLEQARQALTHSFLKRIRACHAAHGGHFEWKI